MRRVTAGKTDTELATLLGVDQSTANRWRNGVRIPDADRWRDVISDRLGIDPALWRQPPPAAPEEPAAQ